MTSTRTSLLLRIRDPKNSEAWSDFHGLYAPLIYGFARSRGLSDDDAEEVRSACYEAIVQQIAGLEYSKDRGRFRSWLRTIVDRRIADRLRKRRLISLDSHELANIAVDDEADRAWDKEWCENHLKFCVNKARMNVSERVYRIFCLLVDDGCSVETVQQRLNVNQNQVYKAKSQMLAAVREVMRDDFPEGLE